MYSIAMFQNYCEKITVRPSVTGRRVFLPRATCDGTAQRSRMILTSSSVPLRKRQGPNKHLIVAVVWTTSRRAGLKRYQGSGPCKTAALLCTKGACLAGGVVFKAEAKADDCRCFLYVRHVNSGRSKDE